jgi:hypothetical protein
VGIGLTEESALVGILTARGSGWRVACCAVLCGRRRARTSNSPMPVGMVCTSCSTPANADADADAHADADADADAARRLRAVTGILCRCKWDTARPARVLTASASDAQPHRTAPPVPSERTGYGYSHLGYAHLRLFPLRPMPT